MKTRSMLDGGSRMRLVLIAAATLLGLSCAVRTTERGGITEYRLAAGTRHVLAGDQIPNSGSAEEVIAALRPEYLQPRAGVKGSSDNALPVAYLDGEPLLDLSYLRLIPAASISEIRFLRAPEASARFRRRHDGGAILLTSRK